MHHCLHLSRAVIRGYKEFNKGLRGVYLRGKKGIIRGSEEYNKGVRRVNKKNL